MIQIPNPQARPKVPPSNSKSLWKSVKLWEILNNPKQIPHNESSDQIITTHLEIVFIDIRSYVMKLQVQPKSKKKAQSDVTINLTERNCPQE